MSEINFQDNFSPIQELKLKDEEVARLSQIRDEVGAELEELTASLFEVCLHPLSSGVT